MARKWCLTDLMTDPITGRLSETKISVLVGKAAVLWAFIYLVKNGQASEWLFFILLATYMVHESWSRVSVAKFLTKSNVEQKETN